MKEEQLIAIECDISTNMDKEHLLILGDTSSITLESHKGRIQDISEMGVLEDNKSKGLFAHVNLAVNADTNHVLGLTDVILWHRELDDKSKTKTEKKTARVHTNLEAKESYKWILGAENSHKRLAEKGCGKLTYVFDREADSYELMAGIIEKSIGDFVIRCTYDRILSVNKEKCKLSKALAACPAVGEFEIAIPKLNHYSNTKGSRVIRTARVARLEVRAIAVEMPASAYNKNSPYKETLSLYLIEAREQEDTVPKGEEPIVWRLFTTHKIAGFQDALRIIGYYKNRWIIEQLFRILKTEGLDIESTELETVAAIQKQIIIALGVATKMLQMVYVKNEKEEQPIKEAFTNEEIAVLKVLNKEYEGKTKKQKNPHNPKFISWAAWIIARLGGWKGLASQRPPGPKTYYDGIIKFHNYLEAFSLFKSIKTSIDDD